MERHRAALHAVSWPRTERGQALEALARHVGLVARFDTPVRIPHVLEDAEEEAWLEELAGYRGFEVSCVVSTYEEVPAFLSTLRPALVPLGPSIDAPLLAVIRRRGRSLEVLRPDGGRSRVLLRDVCAELRSHEEETVVGDARTLAGWIAGGASGAKGHRLERTLVSAWLADHTVARAFVLRFAPSPELFGSLRQAGVLTSLGAVVGTHAAQYVLWIAAWAMIGLSALRGRVDGGWLAAWILVLLTIAPLRAFGVLAMGQLSTRLSAVVKQQLLVGAARSSPDALRADGVGRTVGRVVESEAIEGLALGGALPAMLALVELSTAGFVLSQGAAPVLQCLLLVAALLGLGATVRTYHAKRRAATRARLEITHALFENMLGHATRLVQEPPSGWFATDDPSLSRYHELSRDVDRRQVFLSLWPRLWLLVGMAGALPTVISVTASPEGLAIALGGVILAYRAMRQLAHGVANLSGAVLAWETCGPVFEAVRHAPRLVSPDLSLPQGTAASEGLTVRAIDLSYRHRSRSEATFAGVTLELSPGSKLVLEGPSGSGKSTLGALLAGIREVQGGALLVDGFDRQSLGATGWRKRVASAPQFHENHVFAATLLFNLLMGRRWPPGPSDLAEAEALCEALGLGEVIARMPAGYAQMMGETGWQLSHGERSRVFLARALLQGAGFVILDESLGALDPETLRHVLALLARRPETLLVLAHP